MFGKERALAYAITTAIFAFVPEEYFAIVNFRTNWSREWNILSARLIVFIVTFCFVHLVYNMYKQKRNKVFISGGNFSIQVEYGDLLQVSRGKVVINFDECFTTKVGEKPAEIKPMSICGQYLTQHPIDNIQYLIDKSGIKPARGKSRYNDQDKYTPGTIIPNGNFLLMAFTKLDKNGLGCLTYEEYIECLEKLWEQIDLRHGTSDVYLPILGSNIVRFDKDLTQQELLDIMINSYRLSPKKMRKPYTLYIMCKKRDGFSLNDIWGVE